MIRAILACFAIVLPISGKPSQDIAGKVVGVHGMGSSSLLERGADFSSFDILTLGSVFPDVVFVVFQLAEIIRTITAIYSADALE